MEFTEPVLFWMGVSFFLIQFLAQALVLIIKGFIPVKSILTKEEQEILKTQTIALGEVVKMITVVDGDGIPRWYYPAGAKTSIAHIEHLLGSIHLDASVQSKFAQETRESVKSQGMAIQQLMHSHHEQVKDQGKTNEQKLNILLERSVAKR